MSVTQFIPQVWSARILAKLQSTLIYGQGRVVNTDYQGDLSNFGDTVYAHGFSDVTVAPYLRNSTVLSYEELTDERRAITIDQSDYFGVRMDDLDQAQMQPTILDRVSQNAAYQLARVQDTFLSGMYANAGATLDDAGTARAITAANAYQTFVEAGEMLDDADVPEDGRYAVVPPWMASQLLLDDRYFLKARGDAVLNGQIGQIAGISVLKSNRVPTTGTTSVVHNVMVGHNMAITFASQINKTEAMRDKDSFADLLRGLQLYGGKVLYPEALINLRASQ
jgi:N4-gp56 family major capsid protein